MTSKIRIGIIGAAGLSAGKLIEILSRHARAELHTLVSDSSPGALVTTAHPQLRNVVQQAFEPFDMKRLSACDLVFSCKKAGETFPFIRDLVTSKVRFIDLSGDYRLKDSGQYENWYGIPHGHADLLEESVYGLPELHREKIRKARILSNPGCYTTTSILACAPLVAAGYDGSGTIVIDAISGVSGAGRAAKGENLYISVAENVRAYRVGNHQHTPEIEQELRFAAQGKTDEIKVLFVPHVGPYKVGIMADCYFRVDQGKMPSTQEVHDLFAAKYANEPFVRLHEPGSLPQIEHVAGTNFCDIGVTCDARTRTIVVVSVTDNLMKGAASQAVQNMNIMFGFSETEGLL